MAGAVQPADATRFDYWQRMEFTEEQWAGLRAHAQERGLAFLSSPFSLEAVDAAGRVGVAGWKVASGEVGQRGAARRRSRPRAGPCCCRAA